MDILLEVLKWIIIVLLAGFIGQFGKSLGLHVLDFIKNRKKKSASTELIDTERAGRQDIVSLREKEILLKDAKKAKKAQLKAIKKSKKSQMESS